MTGTTDADISPFKLSVSLDVLEHLGDGLYSNVAAVLSEAVANAWDADSLAVFVDVDISRDVITIRDTGVGMDVDEINNRFLNVGYKKRNDADETDRGRPVMGRKGIGKLSLFSIANSIQVETKKSNGSLEAFIIEIGALRAAIDEKLDYYPREVEPEYSEDIGDKGTLIKLSDLRTERLSSASPDSLRRKLARRFSVLGSDEFNVSVDGIEVSTTDRDDIKFAQYIWRFSGTELDQEHLNSNVKIFEVPSAPEGWSEGKSLSGWIGTVDKPNQLSTSDGNLNSVVVHCRGRLADEDILTKVTSAEIYTKYVTGQIRADFLDLTAEVDIVTSDRQSLREDDPRVIELLTYVKSVMRSIANEWSDLRNVEKVDLLREKYPRIDSWLNSLGRGWKSKAETLLGKVATLEIEGDDSEESRGNLVRHSIYGFERLRLRGEEDALAVALDGGVDQVLKLFADKEMLESAMYRDIVSNRLSVITDFQHLVDENHKERVLQEHLFQNLWLLDPSWDRATESIAMEERLRVSAPFKDDDETKAEYGRVDIRYRSVSGKHMIVELKRAGVRPSAGQLLDQVNKYVRAYRASGIFDADDKVEVAIVVGKVVEDAEESISAVVPGSIVKTYDHLIVQAKDAYQEYLERTQGYDFIEGILEQPV